MSIYLEDALFIDWQTLEFKKCHMRVEPGSDGAAAFIDAIPSKEKLKPGDEIVDCRQRLVTRSFACGHHHVYSALARGMPAPEKAPENFHQNLQYIWWHLDKNLDAETIEASALVTAVAAAKNGVTFVIDHHASPFAVKDSLHIIARAFARVGVSILPCYELSDRDGEASRQQGLAETEAFLRGGGQGLVGLHASFTVGDELLKKAVALAERYDSGIHMHVAEDPIDQEYCLRDHKKRVVPRLHDAGVLAFKKTILVHCLHLDEAERGIVGQSGVYVAQNTESNMKNGVGTFTSRGLGEHIMLGTDGMHSDMLRSAKAAFLAGQEKERVSDREIYERFRRVHRYLAANRFSGDGENNLVILEYDSPTGIDSGNFLGHFIYGIESRHVHSVIANGRFIVRERHITRVDPAEVLAFSREAAKKLWQKMIEKRKT